MMMELLQSPVLQPDPIGELGVVCLVNAGRWNDVERFVQQHPGCAHSPHVALGLGVALLRTGKWEQALAFLIQGCEAHPAYEPLKTLTLKALLACATERIQAKQWTDAGEILKRALQVEPRHGDALQLMSAVDGAAPLEDLLAGRRANTAIAWEQELVRERKTETAHHLAILYYWWAIEESRSGKVEAAALWQKSIGCWVYVLNDDAYWEDWLARKKPSYEPDKDAVAGLPEAIRREFLDQITAVASQESSDLGRFADDLAMDCWAEFEIASLLKAGGNAPACGPLLMDLVGIPEPVRTPPEAVSERGLRLGQFEMPFVLDAAGLLTLYRSGFIRALACLANGKYDRAETLIRRRQKINEERGIRSDAANEMLAFLQMQKAEQRYVRLKCPPEDCSLETLQEYARQIRELLERLSEVRASVTVAANKRALVRVTELFCRRIYNEFSAFEADTSNRKQFTEAGVDLMQRAYSLTEGIQDIEEARLHLATLVNRLGLQDRDAHDRVITLFERASRLAPDNPNYKRNLAFSYYNRYIQRRYTDMSGARADIEKAYQLAPYDEDIRAGYQQMNGWGRNVSPSPEDQAKQNGEEVP